MVFPGHVKHPRLSTMVLPRTGSERVIMRHKKLALLAILAIAVSQGASGQGTPSPAMSDELVAAETQMFSKITQQDTAFMRDRVADDYFSINADGSTVNKTQLLAQKGSPQQKMMA